jgi:predicted secreted Zn-dependent protease
MSKFAHIVDHPGLVRDLNSQAVINTDKVAIRRHEKRMKELESEKAREEALKSLRQDVDEIKDMIKCLTRHVIQAK